MGKKIVCGYCGHFFDSSDKRCHIMSGPPDHRYPPTCPACTIQTLKGTEVWAVWNDCQGIWADGIGWTKAAAIEHLNSGRYKDCQCKVVPARVYVETEDRHDMREWREDQR
jgi:hypothetical protein